MPPGPQTSRSLRGQSAKKIKTVRAPIERRTRVVPPHFGRESVNLRAGNVRRIGDDQIERGIRRQRRETIARQKPDPVGNSVASGVVPRHLDGFRGNVHGVNPGSRALGRQDDGDAAAARAEVKGGWTG